MHTHMNTHTHIYIYIYIHIPAHVQTHTRVQACLRMADYTSSTFSALVTGCMGWRRGVAGELICVAHF